MAENELVRIGMVQMGSVPEKQENIEKAISYTDEAVSQGADIVVYNELFTTPYFPAEENMKYFEYAERDDGETVQIFRKYAREHKVSLIPTIFEEDKVVRGIFYDTAIFIGKDGNVMGKYRKIHLPQLNGYYEKYYFHPGSGYPVFQQDGYKIGSVICYDRHFQEGPRILSLKGADIVFVPTTTNFYPETWELELRAHAAFNTIFVVGVNRTEEEFNGQKIKYLGKSLIAGPSGEIIAQMSDKEGVKVADVNIDLIKQRREKAPFLADRKVIAYKDLVDNDIGNIYYEKDVMGDDK
ncbi:nitrilase-related carbon-nitrogen hydrolase [Acidiplasma sp.]|uniref:carbon-nitrogen hydrolase family protein n=1 Tax=Acidiplasma sp. TaxID=1872114 RepID=UPI002588FD9A|nr:nitrilase-related carbon-nitrogen hydrolase [Acidiplasma sp.]